MSGTLTQTRTTHQRKIAPAGTAIKLMAADRMPPKESWPYRTALDSTIATSSAMGFFSTINPSRPAVLALVLGNQVKED
jgi:hypothetical protein